MTYREIVNALRARFIAVVKRPTYNYDLDRCEITEWPHLESLDLDFGKTLFMIVPDEETAMESPGWTVTKEAFVDVVAARALSQGQMDEGSPWSQSRLTDPRHLAQTKLVEDIDRAVYSWSYTEFAENIEIETRDRSADRTLVDGWAVVFCRVRLQWQEVWRVGA